MRRPNFAGLPYHRQRPEAEGWRRQHALSVWNAAMSVLMALVVEKHVSGAGKTLRVWSYL